MQIDLLFAHFIIADITSGLNNSLFAEFAPRTIYLLYGIAALSKLGIKINNNTYH